MLFDKYSRLSLIVTPGDRLNMFFLTGFVLTRVTCMHLYRVGEFCIGVANQFYVLLTFFYVNQPSSYCNYSVVY